MGKVILLVEDSPEDANLTMRALKKNNITNEVVVACDGAEALDYLLGSGAHDGRDTSFMPVVVLLDLKMPKVDGIETLRRIRSNKITELIPVVILTTSNEEDDIARSYKMGANSFMRKPVGYAQFTEAVKQLGLYWLLLNEPPPSKG